MPYTKTPHEEWSKHYDEVYGQDNPETPAHGWIQWKGTQVCMDVHCVCGAHTHADAEFAYYIECPVCHLVYATGQNIKLIPLNDEQTLYARKERDGLIVEASND